MSCDNVPTTAEIEQAKKDMGDFNTFMTSDTDTFVDSGGDSRMTLQGAINKFGFGIVPPPFTFTTGGTLTSPNLLVPNSPTDGYLYKYVGTGNVPIVVTAGTNPVGNPDWQVFTATAHYLLSGRGEPNAHTANAIDVGGGNSLANLADSGSTVFVGGIQAGQLTQRLIAAELELDNLPNTSDPAGTAANLISQHNNDPLAHQPLTAFITQEADRAENAANVASTNALIFPSAADGLAATVDGDYFWVVSTSANDIVDLYRNMGGVAVSQGKSIGGWAREYQLVNSAVNQNLVDATGLSVLNATLDSVSGNTATFTTTSGFGQLYQLLSMQAGESYYVAVRFKSGSANSYLDIYDSVAPAQLLKVNHSGSGYYELLDGVVTCPTSASVNALFRVLVQESGLTSSVQEYVAINLTAIFGYGFEPSADEARRLITGADKSSFFTDSNTSPVTRDNYITGKYYVDIYDGVLNVVQKHDSLNDLRLKLSSLYPNYIFNLQSMYSTPNLGRLPSSNTSDGTELLSLGTDTLGPYRVFAINNIDGDDPLSNHFTGGSHGYLNNYFIAPANTPTATSNGVKFFVDGEQVSRFSGYCDSVNVSFSNGVQATNTKKADGSGRNVLTENYEIIFDGEKMSVNNSTTFTEDVLVDLYYGLQMQLPSLFNAQVYYHTALNMKWNQSLNLESDAGSLTCDRISARNGSNRFDMALDFTGMGREQFLPSVVSNAFTVNYNKTYFHLINNTNFEAGDTVSYSGSYRFYSK